MNAAREQILDRVRDALRTPAPKPSAPTGTAIFPAISDVPARFRQEFTALRGEMLSSPEELQRFLAGFQRIASDGSLPGNASVRQCELGVTGCDCLIAQTGSIVVSGARTLSVLPPVHLVIACLDQFVPDLAAAVKFLRERYDGRWPRALSVITGPSRTADIEKILVMGAHGPKRLVLYVAPALG